MICRRQHFAECFCLSAFLDNFNDATLHGVVFQKFLMRHTSILRGAKGPIERAISVGDEGMDPLAIAMIEKQQCGIGCAGDRDCAIMQRFANIDACVV